MNPTLEEKLRELKPDEPLDPKIVKRILRRRFFKHHPIPKDCELIGWVAAYQDDKTSTYSLHFDDDSNEFHFSWGSGEPGDIVFTERFNKDGQFVGHLYK
jgi:hypothetical protein